MKVKNINKTELTNKTLKDYFLKSGMDVDIHFEDAPQHGGLLIWARPKIKIMAVIPDLASELSESDSKALVKDMIDKLVRNVQSYYLKVFELGNRILIPTDHVSNYVIIFNPRVLDGEKIKSIVTTLEL